MNIGFFIKLKNIKSFFEFVLVISAVLLVAPFQASAAPAINSTSSNFPFPQNATYPYGIKPNNRTAAQFQSDVTSMYTTWYNNAVTNTGTVRTGSCTGCYRVYRGSDGNDTVSEGIGYGMLIASVLADKPLFDGLWLYAKQYIPDNNGNYVMDWHISSSGSVAGTNGATDADEDMVEGLLIAHKQWTSGGTINYLSQAQSMMASMWAKEIGVAAKDFRVEPGDGWTGTYYSSYMAPAWYRCWGTFDTAHAWSSPVTWVYGAFFKTILASYPKGYKPENTNGSWGANGQTHGYDASRYGWRIGQDYLWNGDSGALSNVGAMADNVISGGVANIKEYWDISSGASSGSANSLQIGPAIIACMSRNTTASQTFVNGAYGEMVTVRYAKPFTYFQDSLCMISALVASGNFPNFLCGSVGPTATPGSPTATPTRTLTPTVTMTPQPANITIVKSTSAATSNFTTGSLPMTLVVCNSSASTAANSVILTDVTSNYGWMSFNGPNFGAWNVTIGGTAVTITPLNTASFPMTWTLSSVPAGGCVTIPFIPISYSYAASQACLVMKDYGSVSWSGGGPVTSNTISITMQCAASTSTFTSSPTRTYTATVTRTNTPSNTNTFTVTNTPVNTSTSTATRTVTPTSTSTRTNTPTWTASSTATPTYTAVNTATPTRTSTATSTNTVVNTATFSATRTPTPTSTYTVLNTATPTRTSTATSTNTVVNTATFSATRTSTSIPTSTVTPVNTSTRTSTATSTPSNTATQTLVNTATSTSTSTLAGTATFTTTRTPTSISTATGTSTFTSVSTSTRTATWTPTSTPVNPSTSTPTRTSTGTSTPSWTGTATLTPQNTATASATKTSSPIPTSTHTLTTTSTNTIPPTATSTPTRTSTETSSFTRTSTATSTRTPTFTSTSTVTSTPTVTETVTFSVTGTLPPTDTPTQTLSPTRTSTSTYTGTVTSTPTLTVTATFTTTSTATVTSSWTLVSTATSTWTNTPTTTSSPIPSSTASFTLTRTMTPSWTATATASATVTPSPTGTSTDSATTTPTLSFTPSFTSSVTHTATLTPTSSFTDVDTPTMTRTPTSSSTWTPTKTSTVPYTSTPTWTSTSTQTFTATLTASASPTMTATPIKKGGDKLLVYPNPVQDGDPTVYISLRSDASWVRVVVVTDAYRKVYEQYEAGPFTAGIPTRRVKLPLSTLKPANGLYYLILRSSAGETLFGKFLVAH